MNWLNKSLNHITYILLLGLIIIGVGQQELSAAHIVGGDMTYQFVSFNSDTTQVTFRITVTMYRDNISGGAPFDTAGDTAFGVYRQSTAGTWFLYQDIRNINPSEAQEVPPNDDPCVEEPVGTVGVEWATYSFLVTLDIGIADYMIAYQRCCRNESIGNILRPGETGAVFDVIITPEAQITGNNSPKFGNLLNDNYPPLFICAGFPITIDQSATDVDGDDLRYTFCAPFTAGGDANAQAGSNVPAGCCDCVRPDPGRCGPPFDNVSFMPPFSSTEPLAGDPVVSIDFETGIITGTPEIEGQYVVGVCVEEFRNGISIGKIRRDFQFNVLACEKQVNAVLDSDDEIPMEGRNLFVINSCGDSTLNIKNLSTDIRFIQNYHWEFFDENMNEIFDIEGTEEARDADVTFPGIGNYTGMMIVNEGIPCADTAEFVVNLYPAIEAGFDFDYDTCVAGPIAFIDSSETGGLALTDWNWRFDNEGSSIEQFPFYTFQTPGNKEIQLIVKDNNECYDTIIDYVLYQPAPATIIVEPSSFVGCVPASINLNNLSSPIDSTYNILWDFGDGNTSSEISPTHIYEESGSYSLSLEITSPIGCEIARGFGDLIRVKDSPKADFVCSPDQFNIFNRTASFTDLSTDAGSWRWDFGTAGSLFEQNPVFTFPDTGIYKVVLNVFHPVTNCPDTLSKIIDVSPIVNFYFPNAFSPNNDSSNDLFIGNGYYDGLKEYNLTIWNRWGQLVFETDDPRSGWNGREYNSGADAPQGVYVYKASYQDPRGKTVKTDGHITLLR